MIRRQLWTKRTLLVALTGCGRESDEACGAEAGFNARLIKPTVAGALYGISSALEVGVN